MGFSRCPAQLVDPFLQITQHGSFVAVIPQAREALLQQVGFENAPVQSEQGVQLTPLAAVQVEPTAQKQPALPPYQIPRSSSFAEELCPPHFVHRLAGMLQNVKLVVHDPALRYPLLQALPKRFPHVHTRRSNRTSLKRTQMFLEELVQRLFLPLSAEPQWFPRLQIAHHRQKLLLLPQIDLIHSHLAQRRLSSPLRPATQIAHIDGSHRAAGQAKLSCHSSHRRALTGQPYRPSKRLLNGALLGNCGTFSVFTPQSGQRTRYNSTTTVVRNSKQGRSRISRS